MTIALNLENLLGANMPTQPTPTSFVMCFSQNNLEIFSKKNPKILLNISKIHYNIMLRLIFKAFKKHAISKKIKSFKNIVYKYMKYFQH